MRRLRAGRSPFAADREHLHHRLIALGNSHRRTSMIVYSWTALCAVPIVVAAFEPLWVAALSAILIALASYLLIRESLINTRSQRTELTTTGA